MSRPPWRLLRPARHAVVIGWLLPLLMLAVVWIVSVSSNRPVADITRDLAGVLVVPPYVGLLSNIGILLWSAAAAVALLTAAVLARAGRRDDDVQFLVLLGLLSGLLMTDDTFMLHEWVFPMLLGLPPWLMLFVEVVVLMVLLVRFRGVYRRWNLFFLGSALGGFTASIGIDFLRDDVLPGHYLLEDGFKFIGIVNWLAFSVQTSSHYLGARAPG